VFLAAATGGLLVAPVTVGAQQTGKIARVGILSNVPLTDPAGARVWGAFIQGLRDLGYVEGRNLTIVHRSSEGQFDRLPGLAAELVRLEVDVIVAPATQNVLVAMQVSRTIPIVMTGAGDPVGRGLVGSLARPGSNVTGLSMVPAPEIVGKRLALIREIVPGVSRVAALGNPANQAANARWLKELKGAAGSLGMQLQVLEARGPADFEKAFTAMARERAGALYVPGDGMLLLHRKRIIELATKQRMPAMYELREFVDDGGLVVYGPSMVHSFRRAATYVDRILKGANPAEMPVEQPTTFELVVNLKAARGLALTIPPAVLQRADEVIE
jgi:putative ABC transport system substrate-binding protein